MAGEEDDYFANRAKTEREAAKAAKHPKAAEAHKRMADHYLERTVPRSDPKRNKASEEIAQESDN